MCNLAVSLSCITEPGRREAHLSPDALERLADILLASTLKSRRRTKARDEEYPVLSARQLQRRQRLEIPFSCLPVHVKVSLGVAVEVDER